MQPFGVFLKMHVPCPADIQEVVSSFLFDLGASGVVERETGLEAYFPNEPLQVVEEMKRFLLELQAMGHRTAPEAIACEAVADRDWNAEWKKSYSGFAISERIYIKPSWEAAPQRAYDCLIEIDPEMAFGTGTHATTRLCLELLEARCGKGAVVLDIGTGTGILAIAAVKLGAQSVVAFDVDPVAAETARRNAAINQVAERIRVFAGTMETLDLSARRFDLLLANVNRSEIIKLLPFWEKLLDYPVEGILSGILREEEEIVASALARHHFRVCETRYEDEWLACRVTNA